MGDYLDLPPSVNFWWTRYRYEYKHVEDIRLLDVPDNNGSTPLVLAIQYRHWELAKEFIDNNANVNSTNVDGQTPLIFASFHNQVEIVQMLIKHGADVNAADNNGVTPLLTQPSIETFTALVEHGADVHVTDNDGVTPIMRCSDNKVLLKLLDMKVDVNTTDNKGRTALMAAACYVDLSIMSTLLTAGADVKARDAFGRTALLMNAQYGSEELLSGEVLRMYNMLVENGADVNITDNEGRTPLMWLMNRDIGHTGDQTIEVVELLRLGANPLLYDKDRKTVVSYAAERRLDFLVLKLIKHAANGVSSELLLQDLLTHGHFETLKVVLKAFDDTRDFSVYACSIRDITFLRTGLEPPLEWSSISVEGEFLNRYSGHDDYTGYMIALNMEDQTLRGVSLDVTNDILKNVEEKTDLSHRKPYNISLDSFADDNSHAICFRYGNDTVVSIYSDSTGARQVSHLKATAPICTGDGRVIYTKETSDGSSRVYENSIDLKGTENELCHSLSSYYEKNWGCFGREGTAPLDKYFVVYSVIPLRILEVNNGTNCTEVESVVRDYPNFDRIQKLWVNGRDSRDTGIFRGGSRGIHFGSEYLFVGHVTLRDEICYPHWFVQRNSRANLKYPRLYFMFFYTIKEINRSFSISRMSSCFHPPVEFGKLLHKVIFPVGIARRGVSDEVVVSFGADDTKCLITSYSDDDIDTLLLPVGEWTEKNYVFHPNYATSILRGFKTRNTKPRDSVRKTLWNSLGMIDFRTRSSKRMGLIGVSPESNGLFNPAIAGSSDGRFVTAWRRFNGNVRSWAGKNAVSIEACSLSIEAGALKYKRESQAFEFTVGTSEFSGEDPRVVTENGCPILMVNDKDSDGNRRMYVHNLDTDEGAMTVHKFCHNISESFEKNWGPFYANNALHFVYSVSPLVIGRVDGPTCPSGEPVNIECSKIRVADADPNGNLKNMIRENGLQMRGGTPGIQVADNEYLFVGHAVQEKSKCFPDYLTQRSVERGRDEWHTNYGKLYTVFFYTIEQAKKGWKMKRLSCCSHLPGKREHFTKIVFPCGLARAKLSWSEQDSFVVSYGEKDMYGSFCAMTTEFIQYILRPIESWNHDNYVVDVNYFENIAALSPLFRLHNFERYQ